MRGDEAKLGRWHARVRGGVPVSEKFDLRDVAGRRPWALFVTQEEGIELSRGLAHGSEHPARVQRVPVNVVVHILTIANTPRRKEVQANHK